MANKQNPIILIGSPYYKEQMNHIETHFNLNQLVSIRKYYGSFIFDFANGKSIVERPHKDLSDNISEGMVWGVILESLKRYATDPNITFDEVTGKELIDMAKEYYYGKDFKF